MQVEVSVQDYYCPSTSGQDLQASEWVELTPMTSWQSWFDAWLTKLQPDLSPIGTYELSLRLTTDAEMQTLNYHFRQQDRPTDVLAFAALEVDVPQLLEQKDLPLYLGDIVISIDTARRQAEQQGHSLMVELSWLAVHGLLHLLGWDHPDSESLQTMLTQQSILLREIGLAVNSVGDAGPSFRD